MHGESSSCGKIHRNITGRYPALGRRLRPFFSSSSSCWFTLLPVREVPRRCPIRRSQMGLLAAPLWPSDSAFYVASGLLTWRFLYTGRSVLIYYPKPAGMPTESALHGHLAFFLFVFFTVNSHRPRNKRSPVARVEISIKEKKKVNDFFSFCIPSFFPILHLFSDLFFHLRLQRSSIEKRIKQNKTTNSRGRRSTHAKQVAGGVMIYHRIWNDDRKRRVVLPQSRECKQTRRQWQRRQNRQTYVFGDHRAELQHIHILTEKPS